MTQPTAEARDDWDEHWTRFADSASENPAQAYRRELIVKRLAIGTGAGAKMLDVGSGMGDLLVKLHAAAPAAQMLGLELSAKGVSIGTTRLKEATFLQRNLLSEASEAGAWSHWATHATCAEVIEHVEDPALLLRSARAYMAPGCRLVVTVPGGPRSAYDIHIGHRQHFTRAMLRKVLTDAGFVVERVDATGFPFFNIYKTLVILAGSSLIKQAEGEPSALMKVASSLFGVLFKFNLETTGLGWQLVAVARAPD